MKYFVNVLLASFLVLTSGLVFWMATGVRPLRAPAPNPGVLQVNDTAITCSNATFSNGVGIFTTIDGRVVVLPGGYTYFKQGG